MDKNKIIAIFEGMTVLLELKGENPFRVRAYHNASLALETLTEQIQDLIDENRLTEIKGIGSGIAEKITELWKTGHCCEYEKLKKSFPKNFLDVLRVPGLGPRKAKVLYEKLKIKDLQTLEKACKRNKVAPVEGFGERTQRKILEGIAFLNSSQSYFLYDVALSEAEEIIETLRRHKDVIRCDIAGSLRRAKEIIGDVDVLVSAKKSKEIMRSFVKHPRVNRITAQGQTKSSVVLQSGIAVDLRVVKDTEYPFALMYFTGSKEHSVRLRERAKEYGYKLNEYGLFKGKKTVACKSEEQIYKLLDLQYIPPELRENQDEIELASKHKIPKLVEASDLRGTFHVHSSYSDGSHSLEVMIVAAQKAGFEYVGISDHSQVAYYANGLKPQRVKQQFKEIDKLQKKYKNIRIFKGIECDILKDGTMDYTDKILKDFDFVIAAVHSSYTLDKKAMTARIIKALTNPYVTMLAHPTGRLLLARDEYALDLVAVIEAAAKYNKIIEINSHPNRFDLDWRFVRLAKEKGVKICINPDAHAVEGILDTCYGVGIARKGWLTKKDVFNTLTRKEMEKILLGK